MEKVTCDKLIVSKAVSFLQFLLREGITKNVKKIDETNSDLDQIRASLLSLTQSISKESTEFGVSDMELEEIASVLENFYDYRGSSFIANISEVQHYSTSLSTMMAIVVCLSYVYDFREHNGKGRKLLDKLMDGVKYSLPNMYLDVGMMTLKSCFNMDGSNNDFCNYLVDWASQYLLNKDNKEDVDALMGNMIDRLRTDQQEQCSVCLSVKIIERLIGHYPPCHLTIEALINSTSFSDCSPQVNLIEHLVNIYINRSEVIIEDICKIILRLEQHRSLREKIYDYPTMVINIVRVYTSNFSIRHIISQLVRLWLSRKEMIDVALCILLQLLTSDPFSNTENTLCLLEMLILPDNHLKPNVDNYEVFAQYIVKAMSKYCEDSKIIQLCVDILLQNSALQQQVKSLIVDKDCNIAQVLIQLLARYHQYAGVDTGTDSVLFSILQLMEKFSMSQDIKAAFEAVPDVFAILNQALVSLSSIYMSSNNATSLPALSCKLLSIIWSLCLTPCNQRHFGEIPGSCANLFSILRGYVGQKLSIVDPLSNMSAHILMLEKLTLVMWTLSALESNKSIFHSIDSWSDVVLEILCQSVKQVKIGSHLCGFIAMLYETSQFETVIDVQQLVIVLTQFLAMNNDNAMAVKQALRAFIIVSLQCSNVNSSLVSVEFCKHLESVLKKHANNAEIMKLVGQSFGSFYINRDCSSAFAEIAISTVPLLISTIHRHIRNSEVVVALGKGMLIVLNNDQTQFVSVSRTSIQKRTATKAKKNSKPIIVQQSKSTVDDTTVSLSLKFCHEVLELYLMPSNKSLDILAIFFQLIRFVDGADLFQLMIGGCAQIQVELKSIKLIVDVFTTLLAEKVECFYDINALFALDIIFVMLEPLCEIIVHELDETNTWRKLVSIIQYFHVHRDFQVDHYHFISPEWIPAVISKRFVGHIIQQDETGCCFVLVDGVMDVLLTILYELIFPSTKFDAEDNSNTDFCFNNVEEEIKGVHDLISVGMSSSDPRAMRMFLQSNGEKPASGAALILQTLKTCSTSIPLPACVGVVMRLLIKIMQVPLKELCKVQDIEDALEERHKLLSSPELMELLLLSFKDKHIDTTLMQAPALVMIDVMRMQKAFNEGKCAELFPGLKELSIEVCEILPNFLTYSKDPSSLGSACSIMFHLCRYDNDRYSKIFVDLFVSSKRYMKGLLKLLCDQAYTTNPVDGVMECVGVCVTAILNEDSFVVALLTTKDAQHSENMFILICTLIEKYLERSQALPYLIRALWSLCQRVRVISNPDPMTPKPPAAIELSSIAMEACATISNTVLRTLKRHGKAMTDTMIILLMTFSELVKLVENCIQTKTPLKTGTKLEAHSKEISSLLDFGEGSCWHLMMELVCYYRDHLEVEDGKDILGALLGTLTCLWHLREGFVSTLGDIPLSMISDIRHIISWTVYIVLDFKSYRKMVITNAWKTLWVMANSKNICLIGGEVKNDYTSLRKNASELSELLVNLALLLFTSKVGNNGDDSGSTVQTDPESMLEQIQHFLSNSPDNDGSVESILNPWQVMDVIVMFTLHIPEYHKLFRSAVTLHQLLVAILKLCFTSAGQNVKANKDQFAGIGIRSVGMCVQLITILLYKKGYDIDDYDDNNNVEVALRQEFGALSTIGDLIRSTLRDCTAQLSFALDKESLILKDQDRFEFCHVLLDFMIAMLQSNLMSIHANAGMIEDTMSQLLTKEVAALRELSNTPSDIDYDILLKMEATLKSLSKLGRFYERRAERQSCDSVQICLYHLGQFTVKETTNLPIDQAIKQTLHGVLTVFQKEGRKVGGGKKKLKELACSEMVLIFCCQSLSFCRYMAITEMKTSIDLLLAAYSSLTSTDVDILSIARLVTPAIRLLVKCDCIDETTEKTNMIDQLMVVVKTCLLPAEPIVKLEGKKEFDTSTAKCNRAATISQTCKWLDRYRPLYINVHKDCNPSVSNLERTLSDSIMDAFMDAVNKIPPSGQSNSQKAVKSSQQLATRQQISTLCMGIKNSEGILRRCLFDNHLRLFPGLIRVLGSSLCGSQRDIVKDILSILVDLHEYDKTFQLTWSSVHDVLWHTLSVHAECETIVVQVLQLLLMLIDHSESVSFQVAVSHCTTVLQRYKHSRLVKETTYLLLYNMELTALPILSNDMSERYLKLIELVVEGISSYFLGSIADGSTSTMEVVSKVCDTIANLFYCCHHQHVLETIPSPHNAHQLSQPMSQKEKTKRKTHCGAKSTIDEPSSSFGKKYAEHYVHTIWKLIQRVKVSSETVLTLSIKSEITRCAFRLIVSMANMCSSIQQEALVSRNTKDDVLLLWLLSACEKSESVSTAKLMSVSRLQTLFNDAKQILQLYQNNADICCDVITCIVEPIFIRALSMRSSLTELLVTFFQDFDKIIRLHRNHDGVVFTVAKFVPLLAELSNRSIKCDIEGICSKWITELIPLLHRYKHEEPLVIEITRALQPLFLHCGESMKFNPKVLSMEFIADLLIQLLGFHYDNLHIVNHVISILDILLSKRFLSDGPLRTRIGQRLQSWILKYKGFDVLTARCQDTLRQYESFQESLLPSIASNRVIEEKSNITLPNSVVSQSIAQFHGEDLLIHWATLSILEDSVMSEFICQANIKGNVTEVTLKICTDSAIFYSDLHILNLLRHPQMVTMLGYCVDLPSCSMSDSMSIDPMIATLQHGLVLQSMGRGNLRSILDKEFASLSLIDKLTIAADISEALCYLHSSIMINHDVQFRCVKSKDVMVDSHGRAKILVSVDHLAKQSMRVDSRLANHNTHYRDAVEAFGILIWELLTGKHRLSDDTWESSRSGGNNRSRRQSPMQSPMKVTTSQVTMNIDASESSRYPPDLTALMRECVSEVVDMDNLLTFNVIHQRLLTMVQQEKERALKQSTEKTVPDGFLCPITQDIMRDPVILVVDGHSYERKAILDWLKRSNRSPLTNEVLPLQLSESGSTPIIVDNYALKSAINEFRSSQNVTEEGN